MTLEKFTRQQHPHWPAVTIRKNGTICLNHKAIEEYKLEKIRFATLHFDSDESLLGIKPEEDDTDPASFRISREKDRTVVISCQGFLRHNGVNHKGGSKTFRVTWDEHRSMILVKLG